ncbi:MAG: NgoPII family restriction endonuclease [Alistipes sp.]|nr:NgoPII family restriction endonuclease [Alistipes sp.]
MSRNIIDAICTIVRTPDYTINTRNQAHNRANAMGEALEEYIKDAFCDTIGEQNHQVRLQKISQTFSYTANQNNPPDAMLKGGDAIEIKKIESMVGDIPLNSSYPKAKLFSNDNMLKEECRTCEDWSEKDMIYAIGVVDKRSRRLRALCLVYGSDYCANKDVYERIKNIIKNGVEEIPDVEFAETNELGRVNRVDPLGITYLRVRGMWHIEHPLKVFKPYFSVRPDDRFSLMAIINNEKFEALGNGHLLYELAEEVNGVEITNIDIPNPNNPARLKSAKLITYRYNETH